MRRSSVLVPPNHLHTLKIGRLIVETSENFTSWRGYLPEKISFNFVAAKASRLEGRHILGFNGNTHNRLAYTHTADTHVLTHAVTNAYPNPAWTQTTSHVDLTKALRYIVWLIQYQQTHHNTQSTSNIFTYKLSYMLRRMFVIIMETTTQRNKSLTLKPFDPKGST